MAAIAIDTLDDPRLAAYVHLTDLQLRNRLEPEKGLFIAEGAKVIGEALRLNAQPISLLMESKWLESMTPLIEDSRKRYGEYPVFVAPHDLITQLTGYEVTRGALGAFRRPPALSPADVLDRAHTVAVLVGITNAMNVGAIIRNAAALDIDGVLIDATSVDPLYRRALRTSMGTALAIPYARYREGLGGTTSGLDIVSLLRDCGFQTIALALDKRAMSLDQLRLDDRPVALLLGSEGQGLPHAVIESSDQVAKIPMARGVDSLNVAAASAIAFWALGDRRSLSPLTR